MFFMVLAFVLAFWSEVEVVVALMAGAEMAGAELLVGKVMCSYPLCLYQAIAMVHEIRKVPMIVKPIMLKSRFCSQPQKPVVTPICVETT